MSTSVSSTPTATVVGVLALQGAFARHVSALEQISTSERPIDAREIRTPEQLADVDALVLPGGESTTISKLLVTSGLREPLGQRLAEGLPVFGTCAGMILLSDEILDPRSDQFSFEQIDLSVRRNGYGRQIASFEVDLPVDGLDEAFRAVFIRAPIAERVGDKVEVLASVDGTPVLMRQNNVLVASFHPELTPDARLHELFVTSAVAASG